MKLKSKIKLLILLTIAFLSDLSTVSGQTKDSIGFSINESRAVVDAWLTLPKYVQIVDSLNKKEEKYIRQIKDCEDLNSSYKEQNKNYQFYSETMSSELDKQDKEIRKLKFWGRFWRGATGVVGVTGGIIIIIKELKD